MACLDLFLIFRTQCVGAGWRSCFVAKTRQMPLVQTATALFELLAGKTHKLFDGKRMDFQRFMLAIVSILLVSGARFHPRGMNVPSRDCPHALSLCQWL